MKNHLILGNWNALCDSCGRKYKASQLRKRWDGLMVCEEDWEQRHPQDLLRVQREQISVPWSRPYPAQDTFIPENLWINPTDSLGYTEQLAKDIRKYIINEIYSEAALNGAGLNVYAINATDTVTPETERATIQETFAITLGRYFNETMSLSESIKASVNHSISESVSIGETKYFTETEHTLESLSFTESKTFSTNKGVSESLTTSESTSFLIRGGLSLNGAALNVYSLG
jgi:hypothetical protein